MEAPGKLSCAEPSAQLRTIDLALAGDSAKRYVMYAGFRSNRFHGNPFPAMWGTSERGSGFRPSAWLSVFAFERRGTKKNPTGDVKDTVGSMLKSGLEVRVHPREEIRMID